MHCFPCGLLLFLLCCIFGDASKQHAIEVHNHQNPHQHHMNRIKPLNNHHAHRGHKFKLDMALLKEWTRIRNNYEEQDASKTQKTLTTRKFIN